MKRLAPLLLLCALASAASGQAPPDPPKPVVPVASIVVPSAQPLVVFADGTVSKTPAAWQAVDPADARVRVEGNAVLILDPVPGQTYELALVAIGDNPPFAIRIAKVKVPGSVTPPVGPIVVPPAPPSPKPPVTPPAADDPLGLTAATRAILARSDPPWVGIALTYRQTTLADAISAAVASPPASGKPQDFAAAIIAAYQAVIPDGVRATWNAAIFTPARAELERLTKAGKIRTVADVAEAWREIAEALREAPENVNDRR